MNMIDNEIGNSNVFHPGGAKYGNFINYYKFNSVVARLSLLTEEFWKFSSTWRFCLDVGCNSGDLTNAIHSRLSSKGVKSNILAIDIDPILIERAKCSQFHRDISFIHCDVLSPHYPSLTNEYLSKYQRKCFDVVFLFSVTMWIHLMNGDEGLWSVLMALSEKTEYIVLEVQPWKCYKTAVRRMKRLNQKIFSEWKQLQLRKTVVEDIENFFVSSCRMVKLYESERTPWGRCISLFRKEKPSGR